MGSLIIKNGTLYDGTGRKGYRADLLVEGGMIRQIGRVTVPAEREIDATGMAVTPGFVDIHRHCRMDSLQEGTVGNAELAQGITTTVLEDTRTSHIRQEVKGKLPLNVCPMIGAAFPTDRGTERLLGDHPFLYRNVARTRQRIEEAMQDGAAGVCAGIIDIAQGESDVIARALEPLGRYGGVFTVHIWCKSNLSDCVQRVIEIGQKAGCAVHISHFKSSSARNWRQEIYKVITSIEKARCHGQDITCDFYPYEGAASSLTAVVPPAFAGDNVEETLRRLGTPRGVAEFRQACESWYAADTPGDPILGWERMYISGVGRRHNQKYVGRILAEAAREGGYEDSVAFAAHLLHEEGHHVDVLTMRLSRADYDTVARLPYSVVISDSIDGKETMPHPRLYGSFPKIIREYVNERKIYSMEEAVHRMSGKPARRLRLSKRGALMEGYHADINIFDPDRFRDNATFEHPEQYATGLSYCMIGGNLAVDNGVFAQERFGAVV